jgi:aspartate-semialdehyde dehydrogenase
VVELERDFTLEEIFEKFESFKGEPQNLNLPTAPERPLIVRFEEGRPQPEIDSDAGSPERAKGMAVSIGRIRKKGKFLSFFLLVNNLIRGSAGGSILNAEFAYFKRIIGG